MWSVRDFLEGTLLLMQLTVPASALQKIASRELDHHGTLVVDSISGPVLGSYLNGDIVSFRGIPYAQPPVRNLRFQAPKPIEKVDTAIIDATEFENSCIQFIYRTPNPVQVPSAEEQSEDCLFVNIFKAGQHCTDETKQELLPVLVWIHGGGFGQGSGAAGDPALLLRNNPDIILVTFNYRLNLFGYPNSPAVGNDASNPGLRDQRLAISWIHDNIRSFGGDPSRMVLAGNSAGSSSIASYLYAYPDDPIAAGAIMMGGLANLMSSPDSKDFERIAGVVGCRDEHDRQRELDCLKDVDASRLRNAISNQTINDLAQTSGGVPVVDNITVFSPEALEERAREGRVAQIPIVVGHTKHEADLFVPWKPWGINYTFSDTITTTNYLCPASAQASLFAGYRVPTWRYLYRGIFPSLQYYPWMRSYHSQDATVLFGFKVSGEEPLPVERAAISYLQSAFIAFVKDPLVGLTEFGWPSYNVNGTSLVELFEGNQIGANYTNPRDFDRPCENPPRVPVEEYLKIPPPCDLCFPEGETNMRMS